MALPSIPDGVCVTATPNALCLRVNWGVATDATSYRVHRSAAPHDGFCQVVHGVVGLTYFDAPQTVPNLNVRNLWYYRVTAENSFGESEKSPPSNQQPYGQLARINVPRPGLSHWILLYS